MKIEKISSMGMGLDQWTHESCIAHFGIVHETYATLYVIESTEKGKGHATELLKEAKKHYESQGLQFGGSVALNENMRKIYQKLNITEYSY